MNRRIARALAAAALLLGFAAGTARTTTFNVRQASGPQVAQTWAGRVPTPTPEFK